MELDELKYQLKNKLSTDHTGRSPEDIAILLTHKTSSIIEKLIKSLRIEIISCIIVVIAFGYIGIAGNNQSLRVYFSVFALLSVAFLVLLIYLLRRISGLSNTTLPVKGNLQMIVNIIEEFARRYFQFTMALIPVCFIFAFLVGINGPKSIPQLDRFAQGLFSHTWQIIVFIAMYMAFLSVGIYYFTRWYLKKLYGKYLVRLKECIAELTEE